MSLVVEVRCCCDAARLLGHVILDRRAVREGDVIAFPLRRTISLKPAHLQRDGDLFSVDEPSVLRLPVGYAIGYGLAIKSNDTPIETLRRIPNFTEAR